MQKPGASSVKWASCHAESSPGYSQASPGLLLPLRPINLLCLYSELWLHYARKNARFFLVRKREMTLKGTVEGSRQKVKVYDGVSRGPRSPRNQAGLPALSKKENVPPGPAHRTLARHQVQVEDPCCLPGQLLSLKWYWATVSVDGSHNTFLGRGRRG